MVVADAEAGDESRAWASGDIGAVEARKWPVATMTRCAPASARAPPRGLSPPTAGAASPRFSSRSAMYRHARRRHQNFASPPRAFSSIHSPRHHGSNRAGRQAAPSPFARGADVAHAAPMSSPPDMPLARRRPLARRLMLRDFRSYAALDLALRGPAGRALRRERRRQDQSARGAVAVLAGARPAPRRARRLRAHRRRRRLRRCRSRSRTRATRRQLGVGSRPTPTAAPASGSNRIDRAPVASARAFADHLRLVWLTPAMDGLFAGPAGERRRFLDRLVLAIDPQHGARVSQFERALRGRNRLLEEGARNARLARRDRARGGRTRRRRRRGAGRMRRAGSRRRSPPIATTIRRFLGREIALEGEVEALAGEPPALAAEDSYRALLRDNRGRDAAAGRTLIGPHVGDLVGPSRPERRAGRAMLDRRAEGVAGRPRARPRAAGRRHVGHRAAGAARRGGGAFRSAPPRRAVRSAGAHRRAGVRHRRGSGRFRRASTARDL